MANLNGTQLYGIAKWLTVLKMSRHKALKALSLKQKLALNYVSRESKLTRIGHKIYSNTFGNILHKPLKEIWQDTSRKFCTPGCICYANKSSAVMAAQDMVTWPLGKADAEEILELCAPHDKEHLPEFYRRMDTPSSLLR